MADQLSGPKCKPYLSSGFRNELPYAFGVMPFDRLRPAAVLFETALLEREIEELRR